MFYDAEMESGVLPVAVDSSLMLAAVYWPEELEGHGDMVLGGNGPGFGMGTVQIVGHKLPGFSNWGGMNVSYDQFMVLESGGGGGHTSLNTACATGRQQVDWNFVNESEGHDLDGYVPQDPKTGTVLGHSGVTVSNGFDIGQHNYADLGRLQISAPLAEKISPYLGLKGEEASNFLKTHPLSITADESAELSSSSHSHTLARLVTSYDTATNMPGAFYGLPERTQTAIADIAFQYGNLAVATPVFWGKIVSQDFIGAIQELNNFHDDYPTRRSREADLIEGDRVESRLLPGNICHK